MKVRLARILDRRHVFITGGTGFVGQHLVSELLKRGHEVKVLARPGSEQRVVLGAKSVVGSALDETSYAEHISPSDTFVHLVGVTHPNPLKENQFHQVDLGSLKSSVSAALSAGIQHFVFVSVAQPAPIMKRYQEIRAECESIIRKSGLNATILRPWYVLGPGRRWPLVLVPFYRVLEHFPSTKKSAQRLGLVTVEQMVTTLVNAVELPPQGVRVFEVPEIRQSSMERSGGYL